jgi:hypothetical protein
MSEEVSRATTRIVFDGPAIANGAMDVQDFAPALLALSQLCKATSRELNGDSVEVTTYIRADIKQGSFDFSIDLAVAAATYGQGLLDTVMNSLHDHHDAIESASHIFGLVFGGAGLFELLRRLKGKKPEVVKTAPNSGDVTVTAGGDVFIVNNSVFKISQSPDVRRAVEAVTKPLQKQGIDSFSVADDKGTRSVLATSSDAHAFLSPMDSDEEEGEILAESDTVAVLGVVRPYLGQKGHRWGLFDGFSVNGYEIKDESFLEKVDRGIYKFGKGDAIRVRLRRRTWMDPRKGLQARAVVVEVLGKIDAPEQLSLLVPRQRRR